VHIGMVVPAQRLNAGETRREMNYWNGYLVFNMVHDIENCINQ
jgi:hypothetical protein